MRFLSGFSDDGFAYSKETRFMAQTQSNWTTVLFPKMVATEVRHLDMVLIRFPKLSNTPKVGEDRNGIPA